MNTRASFGPSGRRTWAWLWGLLLSTSMATAAPLDLPQGEGLVAPAASARPATWAERVGHSANLYRISPSLYRSAQLSAADLPELQQLGIRTVVGLRAFHSDAEWLKNSGLQMQRVKIYTWAIHDAQVVAALRAIRQAEPQGPVLLHCWHGADRTGLIVAMYRMVYQGWTREQAWDELAHGGYGYHSMWKNIPEYLRKVDVDSIRRQVEATAP